jgi:ferredoxin, 2Fe-2S
MLRGLVRKALGGSPSPARDAVASVQFGDGAPTPVAGGTSILAAALDARVDLDHFCGGNRSCGTCRVEIVSGSDRLSARQPGESLVLGPRHQGPEHRLACQALVYGPVRVRVPAWF